MLKCSIGIIAYNEEKNIGPLLDRVLSEKYDEISIDEVIVVSSACTDDTNNIVSDYMKKDSRLSLITESKRNGKSSAINLFLKNSTNEILIIESADTIPYQDTIKKMVLPFKDPKVGMTGGRPVPVNSEKTFAGYAVNLLWRLHHKMALISPKLGEMIAFRRVFDSIPPESAVDEASIEAEIVKKGLIKKYIPNAKVMNKGPEDIKGFITQRKRIEAGHLWLIKNNNYKVVSQEANVLISLFISEIKARPLKIHYTIGVILVEIYSRLLGKYDFYIKKTNPFTWEIVESTKNLKKK